MSDKTLRLCADVAFVGYAAAKKEIEQLQAKNAELAAEVKRLKADHEAACVIVADMHAAAVGEVTGPKLGVIEDVANIRQQLTAIQEALSDNFSESKDWLFDSDPICRINWLKSFHRQHRNDIDELCQQLTIAEAQNARMREALQAMVNAAAGMKCGLKIADEALSLPASHETLDKYVADAIELERTARQQAEALLHKQAETISVLTRQRDLAISAATKARNGAQQCASVCSKYLDVYPALLNMIDVVDCALAAIKESEV